MSKNDIFSPVWEHKTANFIVQIHGNEPRHATNLARLDAMLKYVEDLADQKMNTTCIHTARGVDAEGFKEILPIHGQSKLFCDGAIQTNPSSCISQTADCPTLILYNSETDKLVSVHAGRPACTPDKSGSNIADKAILEILDTTTPQTVTAIITGSIGGSYFEHNADEQGRFLAQPFLDHYGDNAFTNPKTLSIDLVKLLIWQLTQSGIPESQIIHDGLCTYSDPRLSSYRQSQSRTYSNTIAVIKK